MKNAVTEKLISTIRSKVKPAPARDEIEFLRNYYHRLSGQDFASHRALELRDAALKHRKLGITREAGKTLVDIYNLTGDTMQSIDEQDVTVINIITDDKPFTIDSLAIKLNTLGKTLHRTTHPNFEVQRDDRNRIKSMHRFKGVDRAAQGDSIHESYIQFVIGYADQSEHENLISEIKSVIGDIEVVVEDWMQMRNHALSLASTLEDRKQGPSFAEHGELFRWMENHNFAFLGYAEMTISTGKSGDKVTINHKSLLGVMRAAHGKDKASVAKILPPPGNSKTSPMVFTKSRQRSHIHRANYYDCILVDHGFGRDQSKSSKRKVSCMMGFLAGSAAILPTSAIPHLGSKTSFILKESTLRPGGYAYKTLNAILETLPREKLFQMDTKSLYSLCMTVLNHQDRRKTRLHLHRNICGHFYSCLVYVPRELFNSTLRQRIQSFLSKQLSASEVSFNVHFSDSILTRIHYIVHCNEATTARIDGNKLERAVQEMARDWDENLFETVRQQSGYARANQVLSLYRGAFTGGYRDEFSVDQAIIDIERLEQVDAQNVHAVLIQRDRDPLEQSMVKSARFKLYAGSTHIALSDVLPILENMGVRVLEDRPYRFKRKDGKTYRLLDFVITRDDGDEFDIQANAANFQSTFTQAWYGHIENDGFNQLTLLAGLDWKQISLIRAYYRYLKQIRLRYSEHYIVNALANNPELVVSITRLFNSLFNPSAKGSNSRTHLRTIKRQLDEVESLDEDRIVQALLDVINATLRTNYYQMESNGESKPYLSIKLNSGAIPRIPAPSPKYEIFVYSPRVEGVHLRGGDVARGGLRWSERPEDFRTEVLGLVKAQRVKNAVIVPVGSKGGFVAKQLPASGRDEIQAEVIACYRLFISGLLDLTDNLQGTRVIPPQQVVRLDGDDPYLVVAADKGTATFSDIANGISEDYGFWLGDAFASGGSAGYDHKKMGITARGAWESVKRHFRELGKDIQTTDFTVIGIGDMGGDVFGNGMLLSKHIRLLAAFNHMHIFIDPNPDAASSFKERQRIFNLPRSSWTDYNTKLISSGGGIYERSAKSIQISSQAKKALGLNKNKFAPNDLINALLKSDIELLWNGGIGTYVKASSESDAEAQDKNNDGLRVDANQLHCKVIGEGGNLGMTQLGRIEYCQRGGHCYTDAIDNSAGVDTSDHEVNIKILLNAAIQRKQLSNKQRNSILAKMEDEIGHLVLRNNYVQSQILSIESSYSNRLMPQQGRAILALEQKGLLNRSIEFLPDANTLKERYDEGKWLTRPELAVLLSYSKMDLYQALLDCSLPDDKYLASEIVEYFPALMGKKYPRLIQNHRLKREIICTQVTNQLVGSMGPNFHLRLADLTGSDAEEITRAYIAARDILNTPGIIAQVEALDNRIAAGIQMELLNQVAATTELCITWLLRYQAVPINILAAVAKFQESGKKLKAMLSRCLGRSALDKLEKQRARLESSGVPAALCNEIAALPSLGYALDIIDISARSKRALEDTAKVYFHVWDTLGLTWVEQAIESLPASNDWHERARFSLGNDLRTSRTAIATHVLGFKGKGSATDMIEHWMETNRHTIQAIDKMAAELQAEPDPDFAMLSVLISELSWLH